MIRAALERLERALVHDGGYLRLLVLDGAPADGTWRADLPTLHPDAAAWLGWRQPGDDMVFLRAVGDDPSELLGFEKAAKETEELQAELPGYVVLLGGSPQIACDAAGRVSRLEWGDGDRRIAVPLAVDVPGLVDRIAARISERRHSRWRRMRVAVDPDAQWSDVEIFDELESAPTGTLIAWAVEAPRRIRAQCAIKVEDEWATTSMSWRDGFDPEEACWSLRVDLGLGDVTASTSEALTATIERMRGNKKWHGAVRGSVRVWPQPPIEELLARFADAVRELPIRFAPGITDPSIANDDLRALYAFANGSQEDIFFRYKLVSIESARKTSRGLLALAAEQFGDAYWHASFVPFLDKGNGDNLYVDVNGIHGPPGSVIDFDHERAAVRSVLYDSVAQWLECLVEGLEAGLYEWADEGVFPRGFLDGGDLVEIRKHDHLYTNGAYPWKRQLALRG